METSVEALSPIDLTNIPEHAADGDEGTQATPRPRMIHRNIRQRWADEGATPEESLPSARFGHTAVVSNDSMILFGGRQRSEFYNDVWAFDLRQQLWSRRPSFGLLPSPRAGHTATLVDGSKMIVVGGGVDGRASSCLNDIWEYDVSTLLWKMIEPSTPTRVPPRKGHTALNYQNRFMMVFGGSCGSARRDDNEVWVLDLTSQQWSVLPTSRERPSKRSYHVSEMTDRNTMVVFGGRSVGTADDSSSQGMFLNDLYELSLSEDSPQGIVGQWRRIDISGAFAPSGRMCASSIFHNGVLCVFMGGSSQYCSDSFEFDFYTNEWRKLQSGYLMAPCTRPTTVLHKNTITMFGGCGVMEEYSNKTMQILLEEPSLKELCREWMLLNRGLNSNTSSTNQWSGVPAAVQQFVWSPIN